MAVVFVNISLAVQHIYPQANPKVDYLVQDNSDGNGPYIAVWNLPSPQPTPSELSTAWEIIKDRPPAKTPEQKEMDKLKADNTSLNDQLIGLWETLLTAGVL